MPGRTLPRLAVTLACVSAVASHAFVARGASLRWRAPSQCPTEAEVIARVDASRGAPLDEGPPVVFSAEVASQAGAPLTLTLRTQSVVDRGDVVPTRTITARDCQELVAALIELIALTLGPPDTSARASTAPAASAPAQGRHAPLDRVRPQAAQRPKDEPSAVLAVLMVLDSSSIGVPALGGRTEVAARLASLFSVRASGTFYPARTVSADGRSARFSLAVGGASACVPTRLSPWAVAGCGGLEGGLVSAIGVGVTHPYAMTVPWLALAPEFRLGVELSNRLSTTLLLGAVFPLLRREFLIDGQPIHAIPAFSARSGLGFEFGW